MEEPNKSALALLQHEASALLALFDQLRGDAARGVQLPTTGQAPSFVAMSPTMPRASLTDAARAVCFVLRNGQRLTSASGNPGLVRLSLGRG